MSAIIAGRFDQQARAAEAIVVLEATGFGSEQIATFFVNPPGQHDLHGTNRDPDASAGAHHAGAGAAAGAATGSGVGAAVGLATVPVLGPAGPLVSAAIGAYVGSLAGALKQTGDSERAAGESANSERLRDEAPPRKSGVLVAVSTASPAAEASAVSVLRARGAADIERAQGSITQSHWNDFDPLRPPTLVVAA